MRDGLKRRAEAPFMNPTEAEVNAPLLKKARPPSDSSHALLAPLLSCMPVHDKARIHAERLGVFRMRACVRVLRMPASWCGFGARAWCLCAGARSSLRRASHDDEHTRNLRQVIEGPPDLVAHMHPHAYETAVRMVKKHEHA